MNKTIGQFGYILTKTEKGDQIPTNPIVQICLQKWSEQENGGIVISPHLMTAAEIDWHIDAYIKDLEAIRHKAKKALIAAT
jgi:hypothetical protein